MTYEAGTRVQAKQGRSWRPGTVAEKATKGQDAHVKVKLDNRYEPVAVPWIHVRKIAQAEAVRAYGSVADAPAPAPALSRTVPTSGQNETPVVVDLLESDEEDRENVDVKQTSDNDSGDPTFVDSGNEAFNEQHVETGRSVLGTDTSLPTNVPAPPAPGPSSTYWAPRSGDERAVPNSQGTVNAGVPNPSKVGSSNAPGTTQWEEGNRSNTRAWLTAKAGDRLARDLPSQKMRSSMQNVMDMRRSLPPATPLTQRPVQKAPVVPSARKEPEKFSFADLMRKGRPRSTDPLEGRGSYQERINYRSFNYKDASDGAASFRNSADTVEFEDIPLGARHPDLNLAGLQIPRTKGQRGVARRKATRPEGFASNGIGQRHQLKRPGPSGLIIPDHEPKRKRSINGPDIAPGFSVSSKFPLGVDKIDDEEDAKVLRICDDIVRTVKLEVGDASMEQDPNAISYRKGKKRGRKSAPKQQGASKCHLFAPKLNLTQEAHDKAQIVQQNLTDGYTVSCRCKVEDGTIVCPASEAVQCSRCSEWLHATCFQLTEKTRPAPFPVDHSVENSFMCIRCADQFYSDEQPADLSNEIQLRQVPCKPLDLCTAWACTTEPPSTANVLSKDKLTSRQERQSSQGAQSPRRSAQILKKAENVDIVCSGLGTLSLKRQNPYLRSLKKK